MTTRRRWLADLAATSGVVGLAGCAGATPATSGAEARTFLFIPGTWHGGWAWTPVCEALRALGHRAFAATPTGVGERSHLADPGVNLETHIRDILQIIEYEELNDVVLVAHSFAGMTLTGVADVLRERLARLVFYDAFVPTRDRPAWVMREADGSWPAWWRKRQANFVDGYQMRFFEEYPIEMLVDPQRYPAVAALLRRRLSLHPAAAWTTPVSFANGGWEGLPRSYVHCTGQAYRRSSEAMWAPARGDGWHWVDYDVSRAGMLTHPQRTAALLAGLPRA
ncbi:MAG: alpha/beta hydrolase [Pseudomonadota bacterium]